MSFQRRIRIANTVITWLVIFSLVASPACSANRVSAEPLRSERAGAYAQETGPSITLTQSDSLLVDQDGDGQVEAGDTLRYTLTASNTGSVDASGVSLLDALDANLTLATGTLHTTPLAYDQALTAVEDGGQVPLTLQGADFDGDLLTYTIVTPPARGFIDGTPPNLTYRPNVPDYFGSDSLTFEVCDAAAPPNCDTALVEITIEPVNDAPSFTASASTLSALEDHSAYTISGWALDSSAGPANESGQALSFSAANDNNSLFSEQPSVSTDGALHFTLAEDRYGTAVVTVALRDDGGTEAGGRNASAPQTLAITVEPVNDAPSFSIGSDVTVPENAGPRSITDWASAIVPGPGEAGQALSFQITGNTNSTLFAAGPAVTPDGTLNFTTTENRSGAAEITLRLVDDGGTGNGGEDTSPTQSFIITVQEVNDAPVVDSATFDIDENSPLGTVVGAVTFTDIDLGQTHSYAITAGNSAGIFTINPSSGIISVARPELLNYETTSTLSLTVTVTDDGTPSASGSAVVDIHLNDVNDAPVVEPASFSLPENSPTGSVVGSVIASDQDPSQTLAFAITGGNTGGAFTIDQSGEITVANPAQLDFETTAAFNLTVRATDSSASAAAGEAAVTINLSDANEAPRVSDASFTVYEDSPNGTTVGTVTMTDPDGGQTHSFAITEGNTDGAFSIDASGDITVANSSALDFAANPVFNLTVTASDNAASPLTGTGAITIAVTEFNDPPVVNPASFSIDENNSAGVVVGQVTFTDPDEGQVHTFSIVSGNEDGDIAIDSSTGRITAVRALNFETHAQYTLVAAVSDDGVPPALDTAVITVTVNDRNEPPVISPASFNMPENSPSGASIGALAVSDPETGQTHSFAITSGNGSGFFAIDSSGRLSLTGAAALNYETLSTYELQIEVTDSGSPQLSTIHTLTIHVTDVNEVPSLAGAVVAIDENTALNTVVTTLAVSDPDSNQTHSYEIIYSSMPGAFAISSSGVITVANAGVLNFEGIPTFTLTVRVTDSGSPALNASAGVTINLNDVNEAPIVHGESYQAIGNTLLQVGSASTLPAPGIFVSGRLLANDSDPDAGDEIHTMLVTTSSGALVNLASDGTFTYAPPAGSTSDSFTYRVMDKAGLFTEATVQIELRGMVWYVKNDAAAGGLGRSADPFDTLAEAQTASSAGDTIYVYSGSGDAAGQETGIALKNGQRLIGSGVALEMPVSVNGGPTPTPLLLAGQQPQIGSVSLIGSGVTINNGGAVIRGLNIAGNTNAISAEYTGANGGALVIEENTIRGAGTNGISIIPSSTSTVTVTVRGNTITAGGKGFEMTVDDGAVLLDFSDNTISAGTDGIWANRTGGTLTITGFSDNQVNGGSNGSGAVIQSALFDSTPGGTLNPINLGAFHAGADGSRVGGSGLRLTNVEGTLNITDLEIYNQGAAGLQVSGAAPATHGGLNLSITDGMSRIATTGAPALNLTSLAVTAPNMALSSTGSTTGGVSFVSVTGSLTTTSASTISHSAGTGFLINGGSANLIYNGSIQSTGGRTVEIHNRTGGSVDFHGSVSGSGTGISLHDNTGGAVIFSGGLALNTTTNNAFVASSAGTLTITGAANTIATTTATALSVRNTTIGSSGLTFRSISTGAAPVGIELVATGEQGGLTINGSGAPGSGGAITGATSDAVRLNDTRGVTLNDMNLNSTAPVATGASCGPDTAADCAAAVDMVNATNITLNRVSISGSGQMGISGSQVSGLTLNHVTVTGAGNSNDEYALLLHNPSGVILVQDSTFTNMYETGFRLSKDSGDLLKLTLSKSSFGFNNSTGGEDGFQFKLAGSAAANILVDTSAFSRLQRDGIDGAYQDTAQLNLTVTGSTFEQNYGNGGVIIAGNGSASANLNLNNNIIRNNVATAITLTSAATAQMNATLTGNAISHPTPVGTQSGEGIRLSQEDNSSLVALLQNNQVSGTSRIGLAAYARLATSAGRLDLTASNNTIQAPLTVNEYGMDFITQDSGNTICLDLRTNTANGNNAPGIHARNAAGAFLLEGAPTGPVDAAAATTFLNGRNTSNQPVFASTGTDLTFTGLASGQECASPVSAVLPTAALNQGAQFAMATGRAAGLARLASPAMQTTGELVQVDIGALPAGKSVTIVFDVVISDTLPAGVYQISNQAAVRGGNFTEILSDDPATPGAVGDPTVTTLYNTPTAVDDLYTLTEDTFLDVDAPGVLENDLASAGYTLTATADTYPSSGIMALTGDGWLGYIPDTDVTGDQTFTYHAADGSSSSAPALVTLRILPVNDAPVLSTSGNARLSPVNSGDAAHPGTLVRELLSSAGDPITDVDTSALEGIAITAADTAHGQWQYSTNGGLNWETLGTPAESNARLLASDADTRLRFIADSTFAGAIDPALTFYAWDRTTGSSGGAASVITRGGSSPYSNTAETASIVVNPIADLALESDLSESITLAGNQVTTTLRVDNHGPFTAQAVAVTASLPAGFTPVSMGTGCSASGHEITCTQGSLAAGASASFSLTFKVDTAVFGAITILASVTTATADPHAANNSASAELIVIRQMEVLHPTDTPDPALWSSAAVTQPSCGSAFTGEFGSETVTLSLDNLPQHNQVIVEFDLLILRSWDGNDASAIPAVAEIFAAMGVETNGPDIWSLTVDGQPRVKTTFSNWETTGQRQAFPGAYPGGSHPARTGASSVNTLCYSYAHRSQDTTYHLVYTVPHDRPEIELAFAAAGLETIQNESWGLDNVSVRLSSGADPKPYKIFLPQAMR